MEQDWLIKNGRVIDPSRGFDQVSDIFISRGRIAERAPKVDSAHVIDARGLIVAPGLIDMHVHLREPGQEDKETIETGTAAAAVGGFTAVACMPNTSPPLDSDSEIEFVLRQAARVAHSRVYPIGALTKGRAGVELAEIGLMVRAGAVAFSDDGDGIADTAVCLRAMQYLGMFDKLFIQHCEDKSLAARGAMHAGPTATRLGLPGISGLAEEIMVRRDAVLARQTGIRYHVAHISTAGAIDAVRQARQAGVRVTAEVCPHHLLLTDEACVSYDPNFKMNPPLRSPADVRACIEGVRDGVIDCLVTDHAPHSRQDKEAGFAAAPFGIIGLETALPLFIEALVTPGVIGWPRLIEMMSTRPAQLLGVPGGTLQPGEPADVTLIDPDRRWTIDVNQMRSRSRNTPFHGRAVQGCAVMTMVDGQVRYRAPWLE